MNMKKMTFGKLKSMRTINQDVHNQIEELKRELMELDFECRVEGRLLIAYSGALSFQIRVTTDGIVVVTRHGAQTQLGHEEKLNMEGAMDYISTKIASFLNEKSD